MKKVIIEQVRPGMLGAREVRLVVHGCLKDEWWMPIRWLTIGELEELYPRLPDTPIVQTAGK